MQILIKIDDDKYNSIMTMYDTFPLEMKKWGVEAIKNGTPLKDLELEVDKRSEMHSDGEIYITNFEVHRILDADRGEEDADNN